MKQLKIFGVPVASFGEPPKSKPGDINNIAQVGSLPDTAMVPSVQTKFLSPRYEPSNISQDATVQRVQSAIRQAEAGDPQELFRFYRDVVLSDDHVQACCNTRYLATLSQPFSILPEDKNNPDDVTLAAAFAQAKKDCENWNQGLLALMGSNCIWPVSVVERLYRPAGEATNLKVPKLQYTLRKFVPVNPQLHCYQWAYMMGGVGLGTGSAIQIAQMAGQNGANGPGTIDGTATPESPYLIDLEKWEPYLKLWPIDVAGRVVYDVTRASYLDATRHIVHRGHMLQTFRDNWGGPGRSILLWWLLRGLGRQWFARGMERYGSPFPVGYTDANDPVAVGLMREAFDLAKTIGGLVVGEESRVELKEAMYAGMAQGYETFYNLCNEAISYHITGLKESQQPAGLNAGQSQFSGSVRDDVRAFDQLMLAETLVKQIVIPFRDVNGLKGDVKLTWCGMSDDDAVKFSTLMVNMNTAGLQVTDDSLPIVNDRTGLTWERKAVPAPAAGLPGQPPKPGEEDDEDEDEDKPETLTADLTWLSASSAATPVDDVVKEHSAALARTFRGAMAPVRAVILNSTSPADAEKKLALLFADWPHERVAGIVEQVMQICAAKGVSANGA